MIAIIDYGIGNLHSVSKAIERLGYETCVTSSEKEILAADGAILPGVGAFGDAMKHLRETGLQEVVYKFVDTGKPLLGICLGMQLLFSSSEEYGEHKGLDLLPGHVVRFQGDYKIPHMGWNRLDVKQPTHLLFEGIESGYVYFVHSFHVKLDDPANLLATTDYYQEVTAVVGKDNVFGMQFHPEKSSDVGISLLSNFLKTTVVSVSLSKD
ncbi:imidazole glycerol phosphate synthase subunit HisH [Chengkuizengella axinellae]|uniref:Imidazole glycerol phosphate synthase subunit HisH n=1 Tax=Chengkuizengella axinellae TaxID=3064388 RepID=A0ABT9J2Y1_9BACL|nr:imidazole glycerol phosphate synthase subunit HisH [Chengkuizengella sp. 2205SS18-9]MDP5275818.1 imidazole glycerol phosphate synthase subunit HisH [Chengkuizengella sp. 2205SS18-9]